MFGKARVIGTPMQLCVLLVEDDDDDYVLIRELVAEIQDLKVELIRASSYDSALKTLLDADIQTCLVDFRIGKASGVDFVRKLKAIGCDLPMIILTGADDSGVDSQALAAGAANYLDMAGLDAERLGRALRYASSQPRRSDLGHFSLPSVGTPPSSSDDVQAGAMHVLLIDDDEDDYLLTKELLAERAAYWHEVSTAGDHRLTRMLSLINLGDWVSYHLAIIRGVDPTPIGMINKLKDALSRV